MKKGEGRKGEKRRRKRRREREYRYGKRNIDGIDSSRRRSSSRIGSIGSILSSTWNNCDGIDECATWIKRKRREKKKE